MSLSRVFRLSRRIALGVVGVAAALIAIVAASIPYALVAPFDPGTRGATAERVLIAEVDVLTMRSETILSDRWVIIENGRIRAIADAPPARTEGYHIIDGDGLTLMPGLIDMHVHLFDRTDLINYLTHGVTTVRNMMGMPFHLRWRGQTASGELPGPRIITASPTINQGAFAPFHAFVETPEDALRLVQRYHAQGYDFIKAYSGLQPDTFAAVMAEAERVGFDVTGHQPRALEFADFLAAGVASVEHAEEVYNLPLERENDPQRIAWVVEMLKASDTPLVPTLMAYRNLQLANADPEGFFASVDLERINPVVRFFSDRASSRLIERGVPERFDRKMGIMLDVTRAAYEADAPVLLGTDTGPAYTVSGQSLHDEIDLIAATGVPIYDILYSGTAAAAQRLNMDGEIGVVAEGALAELILVAGDPLREVSTLREPRAVFAHGRYYDADDLTTLRERGANTMSVYATVGWLLWHELRR